MLRFEVFLQRICTTVQLRSLGVVEVEILNHTQLPMAPLQYSQLSVEACALAIQSRDAILFPGCFWQALGKAIECLLMVKFTQKNYRNVQNLYPTKT